MLSQTHVDVCVDVALTVHLLSIRQTFLIILFIYIFLGHKCRARQPVQQQAEETAEAAEICRMSGQEGIKSFTFTLFLPQSWY